MPGVYGLPSNRSILWAYVRQYVDRNPGAQVESDATCAFTLPKVPLPGSVLLYAYQAEAPNHYSSPDIYGVLQTNYRWVPVAQHGNLDTSYPFSELWIGFPVAGVVGGTAVQPNSHRGGWIGAVCVEIPGIRGRLLDVSFNWTSGDPQYPSLDSPRAPENCVAIAVAASDSGSGSTVGTFSTGWVQYPPSPGDVGIAFRAVRKGEIVTAATTGVDPGSNNKTTMMIALIS